MSFTALSTIPVENLYKSTDDNPAEKTGIQTQYVEDGEFLIVVSPDDDLTIIKEVQDVLVSPLVSKVIEGKCAFKELVDFAGVSAIREALEMCIQKTKEVDRNLYIEALLLKNQLFGIEATLYSARDVYELEEALFNGNFVENEIEANQEEFVRLDKFRMTRERFGFLRDKYFSHGLSEDEHRELSVELSSRFGIFINREVPKPINKKPDYIEPTKNVIRRAQLNNDFNVLMDSLSNGVYPHPYGILLNLRHTADFSSQEELKIALESYFANHISIDAILPGRFYHAVESVVLQHTPLILSSLAFLERVRERFDLTPVLKVESNTVLHNKECQEEGGRELARVVTSTEKLISKNLPQSRNIDHARREQVMVRTLLESISPYQIDMSEFAFKMALLEDIFNFCIVVNIDADGGLILRNIGGDFPRNKSIKLVFGEGKISTYSVGSETIQITKSATTKAKLQLAIMQVLV